MKRKENRDLLAKHQHPCWIPVWDRSCTGLDCHRPLLGHPCLRVPARLEASPRDQADRVAGPVDGTGL